MTKCGGVLCSLGLTGEESGKFEALLHTLGYLHRSESKSMPTHHFTPNPTAFSTQSLKHCLSGCHWHAGGKKLRKAFCALVSSGNAE